MDNETPKEWSDRKSQEAIDKNMIVADRLAMKMKFRESFEKFIEEFQKEHKLSNDFRWNVFFELMKPIMFEDKFDKDFECSCE